MLSAQTIADLRKHILTWSVVAVSIGMASVLQEMPGLSGGHARVVVFHAFDVVLFAAILLLAPRSLTTLRSRWRQPVVLAAIGIVVAIAVSTLLHPSLKAASILFRLFAGLVLFARFVELTREQVRRMVAVPMMAVAGLQGLLAFAQLQADSPLGTGGLGGGTPDIVNGVLRAPGLLGQPYVLAAYGLLAVSLAIAYAPDRPTWRWHLGTAGAVAPVALSFGRSVIVGFLIVVGVLAAASIRRPRWRSTTAAAMVGFLVPALFFVGSWTKRIEQTSTGDQVGVTTNVRIDLAGDAVTLIGQEWLTGLGPGQYTIELERRLGVDAGSAYPVHDVPLYVVAELGVILGGAVVLLLIGAAVVTARAGVRGLVIVAAPLGLVVFDVLHVVDPIGMVLLMLTLGAAGQLTADTSQPVADTTVDPEEPPAHERDFRSVGHHDGSPSSPRPVRYR